MSMMMMMMMMMTSWKVVFTDIRQTDNNDTVQ